MQTEKTDFRLPRSLEILLGVVVLLELIAPFFAKSYGVDGPSQLNMIAQFNRLLSGGVSIPRWVPNAFYGFGTTTFYFYPPLAFYATAMVHVLTGNGTPTFLFQITGLLATIASFFTARVLVSSIARSKVQANVGALLYAFAPYRIAELYTRSSISSHVGYIFLPLVWLGAIDLFVGTRERQRRGIFILGISSALLLCSSIPLTAVTMLSLGVAGMVCWKRLRWQIVRDAVCAGLLSFALTAFYLFPILQSEPFVHMHYTLVVPEFIMNDVVHLFNLPTAYHELLIYAAVLLAGFTFWRIGTAQRKQLSAEHITIDIGIVMATFIFFLEIPFLSTPIWKNVLPVTLTQGGERFYIQLVLFVAVLIAIAQSPQIIRAARAMVALWMLGALFPAILIVFNLHVFHHTDLPVSDPEEYLPTYVPASDRGKLPWIASHEFDPPAIADLQNNEQLLRTNAALILEEYTISFHTAHLVTFHRFYWPYWHLDINGVEIPSHPDSLGRADATLPAGNYIAAWKLERTPIETAGLWISLCTVSGLLLYSGIQFGKTRLSHA